LLYKFIKHISNFHELYKINCFILFSIILCLFAGNLPFLCITFAISFITLLCHFFLLYKAEKCYFWGRMFFIFSIFISYFALPYITLEWNQNLITVIIICTCLIIFQFMQAFKKGFIYTSSQQK
jgi:hypothetical protein